MKHCEMTTIKLKSTSFVAQSNHYSFVVKTLRISTLLVSRAQGSLKYMMNVSVWYRFKLAMLYHNGTMCFKSYKQLTQPIYYVLHRAYTAHIQSSAINTLNHKHRSLHYILIQKNKCVSVNGPLPFSHLYLPDDGNHWPLTLPLRKQETHPSFLSLGAP